MKINLLIILILAFSVLSCSKMKKTTISNQSEMTTEINKSNEEWRKLLTPVQFNILREKGTERPFTGEYDTLFEQGTYFCAACNSELFRSSAKYNSGCGWPAFYEPSTNKNITEKSDYAHGMIRTEVLCTKCGGHLGHVFEDGPEPSGLRYCINSGALKFVADQK